MPDAEGYRTNHRHPFQGEEESVERFSKKARRHAKESKMRTERMLADAARRSGPVTVSYLPGFEPPPAPPAPFVPRTRFPFEATITGPEGVTERAIVWLDWIEYPDREDPGP